LIYRKLTKIIRNKGIVRGKIVDVDENSCGRLELNSNGSGIKK
jgi:carbamoylphosphate synthase small subunit